MAQLRQDYDQIKARDAEVIVIGPEDAAAFRREWQKETYPFIGVPDPEHKVADLYGQEVRLLRLGRLPALVVVDKQGRIVMQHHGESMRDIVTTAQVLAALDVAAA